MIARIVCVMMLCVLVAPPAQSQIVNTLRGPSSTDMGWTGNAEGSVAFADGNSEYLEFDLESSVLHQSSRNRWRLTANFMQRRANDNRVAENQFAHLRHNFRLHRRVSTVAFTQWAHSPFRRIETRLLLGAGLRFDVVNNNNWQGAVGATYMFEHENISQLSSTAPAGTVDDSGSENDHRASLFVSLLANTSSGLSVDVVGFWQPLLNNLEDARFFVTASTRFSIVGDFYALFQYHLSRDTNPPFGVLERDQSLKAGVGVTI